MIGRYRVSLGDVQMDSLDENLLILDVKYSPVTKNLQEQTIANLDGFDIEDTSYGSRTVTVSFELHIYDVAERNKICQKVNQWAESAVMLKTNDREGQYLIVHCAKNAEIESARNWTDPLTLVFETDVIPFWQSVETKTVTIAGRSARGTLKLDGNFGNNFVSVEVTAGAAVTALQLTTGSTTLKLTGLSVAAGQKVIIDYIRGRYLRIMANGASVMGRLDTNSSDNLKAKCNANTAVSVASNNSVTAVFTARGLWL